MTIAIAYDRFADVFGDVRGTRENDQAFATRQASGLDGRYIIDQMKEQWGTSSEFALLDNQDHLIEQALLCINSGQEDIHTTTELTGFLREYLVPARNQKVWGSRVWRAGIEVKLDFIRLPDNPSYVRDRISEHIKGSDLAGLNAFIDGYYADQAADFFAHALCGQNEEFWTQFEQYEMWRENAGLLHRLRRDKPISKVMKERVAIKYLRPWLLENVPRHKTLEMLNQIICESASC